MNSKPALILGGAILLLLLISFLKLPFIIAEVGEEKYLVSKNEFQLQWIHSVEKEPWIEYFIRDGEALLLTKTVFHTFGAGVPSDGEILNSNDGLIHMEINRSLDELNVTISKNVQTTLVLKNKEIPIHENFDHFSELNLRVEYIRIFDFLRKERLK